MLLFGAGCYHYAPVKGVVPRQETVICVHGLFDNSASMGPMARYFARLGYDVHVIAYSSTRDTIENHIRTFEDKMAQLAIPDSARLIHFIGHSLGGLLIRGYLNNRPDEKGIGRIVTISTPHRGSPIADRLAVYAFPRKIAVPVEGLKTEGDEAAIHMANPASRLEIGTIAGGTGRAAGFYAEIGSDNDGVVPEYSTHLEGEKDHIVLPYTHSVIHWRKETIEQTAHFITEGSFIHE